MKQVFLLILSIACFYSCSDEELEGCTDPYAINFNGSAVKDDGSCQYAEEIRGCTNPLSDNYNPAATVDDGSCIISGCTDPEAENYDPLATIDDGSCITIDDREVFVGSWEVESDCGFQFPIAQQQEITIDSTTADSVLIAPFLQLGGGGV